MKDIRKKGLLSCIIILAVVLAMAGGGCRSDGDKEKKEEAPGPCLAAKAYQLSMGAASSLAGFSEGLKSLTEEISIFIDGKKREFESENWDGKNGETDQFFARMDSFSVYFSEVKGNSISGELAQYLVKALEGGTLVENLQEIEAEYELLREEEKQAFYLDLPDNRLGDGIARYYSEFEDDNWYRVSLTEAGDDIIVEHVEEDGCTVNYFFWNDERRNIYSQPPMRAGGQAGSQPYFIEWDGENYLAIPYWDRDGKTVIGVTVYKYWHCDYGEVLAVGKNNDSSICIIPQVTSLGEKYWQFPFNATEWPIVVRY